MGTISVWVFKSEWDSYINGNTSIGWSVKSEYHRINLIIPIEEVICVEESNDGSVEITFKNVAK
jgi:hypothetical protein